MSLSTNFYVGVLHFVQWVAYAYLLYVIITVRQPKAILRIRLVDVLIPQNSEFLTLGVLLFTRTGPTTDRVSPTRSRSLRVKKRQKHNTTFPLPAKKRRSRVDLAVSYALTAIYPQKV